MTPTPLSLLLSEFRRDSADQVRELRRHRHFVGRSERRRTKSARARRRIRASNTRWPILVIRPIKSQEE